MGGLTGFMHELRILRASSEEHDDYLEVESTGLLGLGEVLAIGDLVVCIELLPL